MGLPLQSIELMGDMTVFTICSVAVLLTGANSAQTRALHHGQKIARHIRHVKTVPEIEQTFFGKLLKELQNIFVISTSLASIYSMAAMEDWNIISVFLKSTMFYMIGAWCLFIATTAIVSAILRKFRPHFFHLYFLVAIETIGEINRFLVACVRVQIQLSMITIPLVIIFIFPIYNIELSLFSWNVLMFGIFCYIVLLAMTCIIVKKRSTRKFLYYDLGCLLSSTAMFSFIYSQNASILSSYSPPPPGLNSTQ
jgi:hypothetical protein